jgi:hypothetical protein
MSVEDFDPSDPDIDWVVVMRALNGEKVHANQAEKLDIIRRWQAAGRPLGELARIQGWRIWRRCTQQDRR